jgi:hypothetical protein
MRTGHSSGGADARSFRAAWTVRSRMRRHAAWIDRAVRTRRARAISANAITSPTPRPTYHAPCVPGNVAFGDIASDAADQGTGEQTAGSAPFAPTNRAGVS